MGHSQVNAARLNVDPVYHGWVSLPPTTSMEPLFGTCINRLVISKLTKCSLGLTDFLEASMKLMALKLVE